ncbi:MAG: hypothetical protein KGR48_04310 [Alphaproteobacteria bacterium]|nr:hypothetical protein [Alphaproteobacteria bacterium]MBU6472208.1 hypothetical protein [Alphaproteobacteria bacterium]MDE2011325.1 hypothetical protein [Alphaproteobacteria bacterium]MDE2073181.1 hypothetical protein [Alphaproteobacteria bacterium]MDE2350262.1 hypothetical protein [Alphaproteobacteria bacterium]
MTVRLVPAEDLDLKPRIGLAKLTKRAFDGEDLNTIWSELVHVVRADPENIEAAMDLSLVAQLAQQQKLGLEIQDEALSVRRLFRSPCASTTPRLRVLAFAASADIGGNTPIEFLLQGSDIELYTLYVVPGFELPEALPDHDVAFVAVPDSDSARATLAEIERLAQNWPRPILNAPQRIYELERDRLHKLLSDIPGVDIPATARVDRDDLADIVGGIEEIDDLLGDTHFPLIIRPVGSQAGRGLEKLDEIEAVTPYLTLWEDEDFFVSRFVDYSGADGQFRKYRVVFVDGKAYGCHLAIAGQWNLWYLNADMGASPAKRGEEAVFLSDFNATFGARHRGALDEIARRVGLDYFAIDCAETKTGQLLIFEADIAAIVHDMDPPDVYPYKGPQMQRIFAAFAAMLEARSRPAGSAHAEAA